MYKIYFDDILQADGDIYDFNSSFDITIIREDGFSNDEQILREKSEVNIKVAGASYQYVIGRMQADLCAEIIVKVIDESCGLIHFGRVKANTIKTYPKTKTAECKIYDMMFSADLREVIDTETKTFLRRTKNCGYIEMPQLEFNMNLDPDTLVTRADIIGYDALSLLDFIVKFYTDGVSYVYSDFLTNNKFAITTGFNLHDFGTNVEDIYPTLSFGRIFDEIRKKERIYMEVQQDNSGVYYLRVEHESYFFEDVMLFNIDGIPSGITQEFDANRNFSRIEVGSDKTDLGDTGIEYYPQLDYTAWNEETYAFCGTCAADKNSVLDLVSEFIIDSNIIYEALNAGAAEYNNDSNIFMFRYETVVGANVPILDLDADSNTYVYNLDINNAQTLDKWVDYAGRCIQRSRKPEYYFRCRTTDSDGFTVTGGDVFYNVYFIDDLPTKTSTCIDRKDMVKPSPDLVSGDWFKCTENGQYSFKYTASGVGTVAEVGGTCNLSAEIRIYTDDTRTTLIDTYTDTASFTAGTLGGTVVYTMTVRTGLISMLAGNVATCVIRGTADAMLVNFATIDTFELVDDSFACENLTANDANTLPYIVEFDYPVCYSDFTNARTNKRGYILVNGYKYYLKELKYKHKQMSKLKLIGNQLMI